MTPYNHVQGDSWAQPQRTSRSEAGASDYLCEMNPLDVLNWLLAYFLLKGGTICHIDINDSLLSA